MFSQDFCFIGCNGGFGHHYNRLGHPDDSLVLSALTSMCTLQQILSEHSGEPFLPVTEAHKFRKLVNGFLQDYTMLANRADKSNKLLLAVVPKHHMMFHLGRRSMFLNPRRGNTMVDEDFVGKMKDIVQSCAHGTESRLNPLKVMEKL